MARRPLESEHGDPFTLLNAYDEWIQVLFTHKIMLEYCTSCNNTVSLEVKFHLVLTKSTPLTAIFSTFQTFLLILALLTWTVTFLLQIKTDGGGSAYRWCKSRGIEQQRFYEVTKLKEQFQEILQVCVTSSDVKVILLLNHLTTDSVYRLEITPEIE